MGGITVSLLAKQSKKSVKDVLTIMKGAGLAHTKSDDTLTNQDISKFLSYRKQQEADTKSAEASKAASAASTTGTAGRKAADAFANVEIQRRRAVEKELGKQEQKTVPAKAPPAPTATASKQAHAGKGKKEDHGTRVAGDAGAAHGEKKRTLKRGHGLKPIGAVSPIEDLEEIVDTSKSGFVEKIQSLAPKVLKIERRQQGFQQPTEKTVHRVKLLESEAQFTVTGLAQQMAVKPPMLLSTLKKIGVSTDLEGSVDRDTAILAIEEMGHRYIVVVPKSVESKLISDNAGDEVVRPAVVTVMGHVDHGKTSLLDFIRKSKVAAGEHGGITQHIGAYCVDIPSGRVSFIDTPGHAAFSAMRARGANCTDIVILVVAADDGVQPQTEEAIKHAKVAGVPLVVAINKTDLEQANAEKVRQELLALEVVPESLGGDVQFVEISALKGDGVDVLLEAILVQAEVLDLKARNTGPAGGVVLESRIDKGRGVVATLLVQEGLLHKGDVLAAGESFCKVRHMSNERGEPVKEVTPSIPVEVLGFEDLPNAGTNFLVVNNEREAREVITERTRSATVAAPKIKMDTEAMMQQLMANEEAQELNIILRADTRGTLEAISTALEGLGNEKFSARVLFSGVGAINESDVHLATGGSLIIGFNVRASAQVRKQAKLASLEIRYYSIIYELLEDAEKMLKDLAPPEIREEIIGIAHVQEVFKSPRFGKVAGCVVAEGRVKSGNPIRVLRDNVVIFEGELSSLRRFKKDVNEVRNGTECGIGVKNYNDVKANDHIEVFQRIVQPANV